MQTIQASEVKTRFLRILDDVEQGESIVVTRHGRPVARILPEAEFSQLEAKKAIEKIMALRQRVRHLPLDEVLELRDEGRA